MNRDEYKELVRQISKGLQDIETAIQDLGGLLEEAGRSDEADRLEDAFTEWLEAWGEGCGPIVADLDGS